MHQGPPASAGRHGDVRTHTSLQPHVHLYFLAQYFYFRGRFEIAPHCLELREAPFAIGHLAVVVTATLDTSSRSQALRGQQGTDSRSGSDRYRSERGTPPSPVIPLDRVAPDKKRRLSEGLHASSNPKNKQWDGWRLSRKQMQKQAWKH